MQADDPTPGGDDGAEVPFERRDAAARAGDLRGMADAARDATFGEVEGGRNVVPGALSGDLGPKGQVSAQLRSLSRRERATYGEVPPGSVSPGGGGYLLVPMLLIGLGLIALVVLIGWLAT